MEPTRIQIEALALEMIDSVITGIPIEDSRVELKSDWPDPIRAARRIAAHANSARGEYIYWLIGLDEEHGVCKFTATELSDWWPQVQSHFDGLSPPLTDVLVTTENGPIHVLCFDTSGAPFVVKNPAFGNVNAGPVQREVPWREATSVRSSTREDLIRLLIPTQQLPAIELLSARVTVEKSDPPNPMYHHRIRSVQQSKHLAWDFELDMYVTPTSGSLVVFPVHRTKLLFKVGTKAEDFLETYDISYRRPYFITAQGTRPDSASIETTSAEAIVSLPGKLTIRAYYHEELRDISPRSNLHIMFSVRPAGTERSVVVREKLPRTDGTGLNKHVWTMGKWL